jgi:imidazoleglycerol phosphate synthase glutamine amidotransferase subunit HisH
MQSRVPGAQASGVIRSNSVDQAAGRRSVGLESTIYNPSFNYRTDTYVCAADECCTTQFHPEKSQNIGLQLPKNFVALTE